MTDSQRDSTPLSEFDWSDGIIGIGFLPDEVALPADWTWTEYASAGAQPRSTIPRASGGG